MTHLQAISFIVAIRVTGLIAYTLAIQPLLCHPSHRFIETDKIGWKFSSLETSTTYESYNKSSYSTLTTTVVKTSPLRLIIGRLIAARRNRKRR